jgi:hypothetical protein
MRSLKGTTTVWTFPTASVTVTVMFRSVTSPVVLAPTLQDSVNPNAKADPVAFGFFGTP